MLRCFGSIGWGFIRVELLVVMVFIAGVGTGSTWGVFDGLLFKWFMAGSPGLLGS